MRGWVLSTEAELSLSYRHLLLRNEETGPEGRTRDKSNVKLYLIKINQHRIKQELWGK